MYKVVHAVGTPEKNTKKTSNYKEKGQNKMRDQNVQLIVVSSQQTGLSCQFILDSSLVHYPVYIVDYEVYARRKAEDDIPARL